MPEADWSTRESAIASVKARIRSGHYHVTLDASTDSIWLIPCDERDAVYEATEELAIALYATTVAQAIGYEWAFN